MSFIAHRVEDFDSSDFREAIKKQALLKDPIDLSIGIPEELTPEHIKAAGIKAIQEDRTVYTPANGLLELREAIARKLTTENNIPATAENTTVVPGLTTGLLLVYLAIINPGDEVLVFDPYYPPYPHLAEMAGGKAVYVSTLPTFQPDLDMLRASITHRTKILVINSPNNPTGAVYSHETLEELAQIAEQHNLLVLSDEIYEHYVYGEEHFSIGSIYPNTLTMNGFSKEYAMTGWRLGYVSGPSDVIGAINELQQYIVMSSSSIAQHAALTALKHRKPLSERYRRKRDMLIPSLHEMGFEVKGAEGAFYAFVKAPHDLTDIEFVDKASEHGLIIVPGRAFSQLHGYVRISYGASLETVARGIEALRKTVEDLA